jgi:hypothetical protein
MGKFVPIQEQQLANDEDVEKCEEFDRRETLDHIP